MPTTTAAIIGAGTTLGISPDGTTYTTIGEVYDVKPPHVSMSHVEATHYTSPAFYKEYLAGWLDGGEIEFALNYVTASYATLKTDIDARTAYHFKVTLPDTHTWIATGFLTDFSTDVPNQGKVDAKVKIKVTGQPAYA